MKILALDLALKTGWACRSEYGDQLISGVQDFSLTRGESRGMVYIKFIGWLKKTYSTVLFDLVYYEQPHQRGGAPTQILLGLVSHLQAFCADKGIDHADVHSKTLKKFATGSGNAKKPDMIIKAAEILGRQPLDDNEADAVHILLFAENAIGEKREHKTKEQA